GRTAPPATGRRGTGYRGPEVLRTRPPALRELPGERRLADPVGHVAQPAAGRRRPGLGLPRQGHHRHPARPPGARPRPSGPHRPHKADGPSARTLALARRLAEPVRRRPPATRNDLTAPAHRAHPDGRTGPGYTANHVIPDTERPRTGRDPRTAGTTHPETPTPHRQPASARDWTRKRSAGGFGLKEPLPRYVTTAFVYGSGLGPAQAVRHMRGSVTAH